MIDFILWMVGMSIAIDFDRYVGFLLKEKISDKERTCAAIIYLLIGLLLLIRGFLK